MPFLPGRLGEGQLVMVRSSVITAQLLTSWPGGHHAVASPSVHAPNSCLFSGLLVMERSPFWVLVPPVLHNDPPAWDQPGLIQPIHVVIPMCKTRRWPRRLDEAVGPWHLLALGTGEVSGAPWHSWTLPSTRSHCPLHGPYFTCSTMEDIDGSHFQLGKPKPKERTGLWGESSAGEESNVLAYNLCSVPLGCTKTIFLFSGPAAEVGQAWDCSSRIRWTVQVNLALSHTAEDRWVTQRKDFCPVGIEWFSSYKAKDRMDPGMGGVRVQNSATRSHTGLEPVPFHITQMSRTQGAGASGATQGDSYRDLSRHWCISGLWWTQYPGCSEDCHEGQGLLKSTEAA